MKAFPRNITFHNGVVQGNWIDDGMELRDYFAAKAMQVLMQDYLRDMEWEVDDPYVHFNCAIEVSYRVADAMMKAREQ